MKPGYPRQITIARSPDADPPATSHAPVVAYTLERDGSGWRVTVLGLPADVAVRYMQRTYEPDLKGLAIQRIMHELEERGR